MSAKVQSTMAVLGGNILASEEFFQGRLGCKFVVNNVVALQVKFLRVCAILKGTVVEDGQ